jgi:hypothetical protein
MADWEATAAAELSRLQNPHATKKRATILALVDARLAGTSEEAVWKRDDTCNRSVYHGKWKKDPVFADVLASVTKLARDWKDGEGLRALGEAARRLAIASPVAVAKAIQMMSSLDDQVALRAAFGILDRAGVETAVKLKQETDVVFTESESALDRINRRMASLATRMGTPSPADGNSADGGGAESP